MDNRVIKNQNQPLLWTAISKIASHSSHPPKCAPIVENLGEECGISPFLPNPHQSRNSCAGTWRRKDHSSRSSNSWRFCLLPPEFGFSQEFILFLFSCIVHCTVLECQVPQNKWSWRSIILYHKAKCKKCVIPGDLLQTLEFRMKMKEAPWLSMGQFTH